MNPLTLQEGNNNPIRKLILMYLKSLISRPLNKSKNAVAINGQLVLPAVMNLKSMAAGHEDPEESKTKRARMITEEVAQLVISRQRFIFQI